jgi:hypothetical protein
VRAQADADGEIALRFYFNNNWTDGWSPQNQYRIGYEDPGFHTWQLMSEFNGWIDSLQQVMTTGGSGLYSVVVNGVPATTDADGWAFKVRWHDGVTGNWDTANIGANFGTGGDDAQTGPLAAGNYKFELDLLNGRWRVSPVAGSGSLAGSAVPEPNSLMLLMFGLVLVGSIRRKK